METDILKVDDEQFEFDAARDAKDLIESSDSSSDGDGSDSDTTSSDEATDLGIKAQQSEQNNDSSFEEPKSYDFKSREGRFGEELAYQNSRKKQMSQLDKK